MASTAHTGSVMTFYELLEGDDTTGTEFHGMDPDIFALAIAELESRGKASVLEAAGEKGVKFASS